MSIKMSFKDNEAIQEAEENEKAARIDVKEAYKMIRVKGQLISKCLYEIIVWTKIPTKFLTNSALEWVGQNLSNYSLVFWSKR